MDKIKILFLAANPSDATRLRLGQELRDIRESLQRSKYRDNVFLESREAVRPRDVTEAILNIEPNIVHFSGHGTNTGGLCFEDLLGETQIIKSDALSGLFELVSNQVKCVVLNACHSERQAKSISQHISFVLGMNQAIGDKAAIAFSVGFYKALGAGRSFEEAYKFARVEIHLEGIPEHSTPILHINQKQVETKAQPDPVKYMVILSTTIDEVDKPLLEAMVTHLRKLSGDTSLTLKRIERGSVRLILNGSEDGFEYLKYLIETDQLTELSGFAIQSVQLLKRHDNTSKERSEAVRKYFTRTPEKPERANYTFNRVKIGAGTTLIFSTLFILLFSSSITLEIFSVAVAFLGLYLLISEIFRYSKQRKSYESSYKRYQEAYTNSEPKPQERQIDSWLEVDIVKAIREAQRTLDLNNEDLNMHPLIIGGPASLKETKYVVGQDGIIRYSHFNTLVIFLTDYYVAVYQYIGSLESGQALATSSEEFPYREITNIGTRTMKDKEAERESRAFTISTSSGNRAQVIYDWGKQGKARRELFKIGGEEAIIAIRRGLQQYKRKNTAILSWVDHSKSNE